MKSAKWIFVIVALAIIGYFVVPRLWVLSYFSEESPIKPPQVEVESISAEGIGIEGIKLSITLKIINPNPVPMTLDRATFDVYIDGDYVGRGSFPKTNIRGYSTEYVDTSTVVSWGGGLKGAWNIFSGKLTGSGSVVEIRGNAYIGSFSIPFHVTKEI